MLCINCYIPVTCDALRPTSFFFFSLYFLPVGNGHPVSTISHLNILLHIYTLMMTLDNLIQKLNDSFISTTVISQKVYTHFFGNNAIDERLASFILSNTFVSQYSSYYRELLLLLLPNLFYSLLYLLDLLYSCEGMPRVLGESRLCCLIRSGSDYTSSRSTLIIIGFVVVRPYQLSTNYINHNINLI